MKKYNVIIVFNNSEDKILMCLRNNDPYKGLYNLVGGKVEEGEHKDSAAYRELYEETGIEKKHIKLTKLMDFIYHIDKTEIEVYYGKLNTNIELVEEKHTLHWMDVNLDFFNSKMFAGEGNIGHMLEIINHYKRNGELI